MTWHEWKKAARVFAARTLYDELISLSNESNNRHEVAVKKEDIESQMYQGARSEFLDKLIEFLAEEIRKERDA